MQPAPPSEIINTATASRPFRSLGKRIIAWQIFYFSLTGLGIASVQLGFLYQQKREQALQIMQAAGELHLPYISVHAERNERLPLLSRLEAIGDYPTVGYVILTLPTGEQLRAGRDHASSGRALLDKFSSWQTVVQHWQHPERSLGSLRVYAGRQEIRTALGFDALLIISCQLLGGLALALLMVRIHRRLVGRHLSHIAGHLSSVDPVTLNQTLQLPRRTRPVQDEFDQLCDAFNRLNGRLASYIEAHRLLEDELREHRDGLSALVAERTKSLERLKDFHSLIIAMLTRFMNLPAEHANGAVDHGLAAFCGFFDAPRCLLFTLDDRGGGFRIANAWPALATNGAPVDVWLASDALQETQGARGARIWLSTTAAEGAEQGRVLRLLDASACTIVGVEIMDRTVGLLCLVGKALTPDSDNAKLLELAARVAANMLDHKIAQTRLLETQQALQQVNQELHTLSRYDPLTGLANRRRFDEVKAIEFSRAVRAETPLAVMMCDIDHFKLYNDTYGHARGDCCLKTLADCLVTLFARAGELPARIGGEEFAVLLPGASAELAMAQAERLRQALWDLNLPHSGSLVADRVTVSIGVACLRHGTHEDFDSLLQEADRALYCAKARRNFVTLAE